ncbi:MAG: cation diffusion facilitator family transporter [Oscillospiraceae bacterium]|nr:cation diffusion facilitator family transporter [Oscillospiraceae bacterium]
MNANVERKSTKNIGWALTLGFIFLLLEIVGGIFTHSMSVVAEAIHDSGDLVGLGIAWAAEKMTERTPNEKYTYGYMRFSFFGALVNSLILLITCVPILRSVISSLMSPQAVDHDKMVWLAILGILFKGFATLKTAKGRGIGERVVNLHMMQDVLNWVAVLLTGLLIKFFDVNILDPLLSLGIVIFVLINVARNLKMIFEVLLERAPKDINVAEVKKQLMEHRNITNIHHIHLWLADGINAYSTLHVVVKDNLGEVELSNIKKYVRETMEKHNIGHITVEIEFENERCKEDDCEFEMRGFAAREKHNFHHLHDHGH